MGSIKSELKPYVKSIKKNLSCSFTMKKILIKEFNNRISDYLEENPDSTIDDIINNFGTPEEIAKSFDVNNDYYKAKAKKLLIISIALVISIIAAIAILYLIVVLLRDTTVIK